MEQCSYFTDDVFRFLTELRQHNEREWFQRNKERYETAVRVHLSVLSGTWAFR